MESMLALRVHNRGQCYVARNHLVDGEFLMGNRTVQHLLGAIIPIDRTGQSLSHTSAHTHGSVGMCRSFAIRA